MLTPNSVTMTESQESRLSKPQPNLPPAAAAGGVGLGAEDVVAGVPLARATAALAPLPAVITPAAALDSDADRSPGALVASVARVRGASDLLRVGSRPLGGVVAAGAASGHFEDEGG